MEALKPYMQGAHNMPKKSKAGRFFAETVLIPERVSTAAIAAIYAEQRSIDPVTGQHCLGLDVGAMTDALRTMTDKALAPEMGTKEIERALTCSAVLLSNLVTAWTARAMDADCLQKLEAYAHLALRAQEQQRKTLATLVEIRNPKRAQFIRQLNQAINQQVNNSSVALETPKFSSSTTNELLEAQTHERLDARTAALAVPHDAGMATVAIQHRPQNGGR